MCAHGHACARVCVRRSMTIASIYCVVCTVVVRGTVRVKRRCVQPLNTAGDNVGIPIAIHRTATVPTPVPGGFSLVNTAPDPGPSTQQYSLPACRRLNRVYAHAKRYICTVGSVRAGVACVMFSSDVVCPWAWLNLPLSFGTSGGLAPSFPLDGYWIDRQVI